MLTQDRRVTTLAYTPAGGTAAHIALTHPGDYPQSTNPPLAAKLVAQAPGYLVFTDSFASNPGGIQGECGASETGELWLHVVSLPQKKETLSTLVSSCRQDIEPADGMPEWNVTARTITVDYTARENHSLHDVYEIDGDGLVHGP